MKFGGSLNIVHKDVPALNVGAQEPRQFCILSSLKAQKYLINYKIDSQNDVKEVNEGNNETSHIVEIKLAQVNIQEFKFDSFKQMWRLKIQNDGINQSDINLKVTIQLINRQILLVILKH